MMIAWMTVKEMAARRGFSAWLLRKEIKQKRLRCVRIGGGRAIRLTDDMIDEWMLAYVRPPEHQPQPHPLAVVPRKIG